MAVVNTRPGQPPLADGKLVEPDLIGDVLAWGVVSKRNDVFDLTNQPFVQAASYEKLAAAIKNPEFDCAIRFDA